MIRAAREAHELPAIEAVELLEMHELQALLAGAAAKTLQRSGLGVQQQPPSQGIDAVVAERGDHKARPMSNDKHAEGGVFSGKTCGLCR